MRVVPFREVAPQAWDEFVARHPDGTFFHRFAFNTLVESVFGHRAESLVLLSGVGGGGDILGILPLTHIRSRLFGKMLVSQAFSVRGGPLADSPQGSRTLLEHASARAHALGVGELEIRATVPGNEDWLGEQTYFNFQREIAEDDDANLKAIPRKQRAMVRKGMEAGLVAEKSDDIDAFYRIYADSVHRLGTPVFARRWFHALAATFGRDCDITLVRHAGRPVAGVLSFYHGQTVLPYYGGGTSAARSVKGYDFMYWALMSRASADGYRIFDFGRSKAGTGAFSFKKNWGFIPVPLGYRYQLITAASHQEKNPNSPRYRRFVELWKRLPAPVANWVGPLIARDLG